jgi:hypothetical protein
MCSRTDKFMQGSVDYEAFVEYMEKSSKHCLGWYKVSKNGGTRNGLLIESLIKLLHNM